MRIQLSESGHRLDGAGPMGEGPGSRTCRAGVPAQTCIRQRAVAGARRPGVPFPWERDQAWLGGRGWRQVGVVVVPGVDGA